MIRFLLILWLFQMTLGSAGQSAPCIPYGIYLRNQSDIDNFQVNYPNCREIEGDVEIGEDYNPPHISNLQGLSQIIAIGGNLTIWRTRILQTLSGLDNLTSVGGSLEIIENDSLRDLTGLGALKSIGQHLHLEINPAMTSFAGLDSLVSIGKELEIVSNYGLISLGGIEKLVSIGLHLAVVDNPSLVSLTALSNLNSMYGELFFTTNTSLTSLEGIQNIPAYRILALTLLQNESLCRCSFPNICEHLKYNWAEIQLNAPGCNNSEEVKDSCASLGIPSSAGPPVITVHPNPATYAITIRTHDTGQLSIVNPCGQQLLQREITEPSTTVDVSGLKSGVYVVKVVGRTDVQLVKFIKQ